MRASRACVAVALLIAILYLLQRREQLLFSRSYTANNNERVDFNSEEFKLKARAMQRTEKKAKLYDEMAAFRSEVERRQEAERNVDTHSPVECSLYRSSIICKSDTACTWSSHACSNNLAKVESRKRDKSARLHLSFEDPLKSRNFVNGEVNKKEKAGSFNENGWRAILPEAMLTITLDEPFESGIDGAIELNMRNYDPSKQFRKLTAVKHHLLSVYSRREGTTLNVLGDSHTACWFMIRVGSTWVAENGRAGYRFAWASGGRESEQSIRMPDRDWQYNRTYTWRIEWTSSTISLLLDKIVVVPPQPYVCKEPLGYIFIGRDFQYPGFVGPVYSRLRVNKGTHNTDDDSKNAHYTSKSGVKFPRTADEVSLHLNNALEMDFSELSKILEAKASDERQLGRAHWMRMHHVVPGKMSTKFPLLSKKEIEAKLQRLEKALVS